MSKDIQRLKAYQAKIASDKTQRENRLSPYERLALFFDQGKYKELFRFAKTHEQSRHFKDGLVSGVGKVHGRPVVAYASEFTFQGGSVGHLQANQIMDLYRLARQSGMPIVALSESGGARVSDGIHIMESFAGVLREAVYCSGVVPQLTGIMGHCIGASAFVATLTDLVVMDKASTLCIAGASVNQIATGEQCSEFDMGGAEVHGLESGSVHRVEEDDESVINSLRALLGYLPSNNAEPPPFVPTEDPTDRSTPEISSLIPEDPNTPYDILPIIEATLDQGSFFEIQPDFAPNVVVGFGRVAGYTVGVAANQAKHLAGALDCQGMKKMARFLNLLGIYNIPLVSFVDVPGAIPTIAQHKAGILNHGAQLLQAVGHLKTLKISVVVRRCFGGAYCLMHPKIGGGDIIFAYPNAMIGVMSDQAMSQILKAKQGKLAEQIDALHASGGRLDDPFMVASYGYIDDVIDPADTRKEVAFALEHFYQKRLLDIPPKWLNNPPL